MFLKIEVLISSNYKAICCYSCCPSLGKQGDREICTSERLLIYHENMHFLLKQMKKYHQQLHKLHFYQGNLGVISTSWLQMYLFAPFLYWVRWGPRYTSLLKTWAWEIVAGFFRRSCTRVTGNHNMLWSCCIVCLSLEVNIVQMLRNWRHVYYIRSSSTQVKRK